MNWLSFFMGVTAAWVFMGLTLFLFDRFRKPKNDAEEKLLAYWERSEAIGWEKVRVLLLIANALKKDNSK